MSTKKPTVKTQKLFKKVGEKAVKKEVEVIKKESKSKVSLVTFSIKATIPTQQYGNIMPEIVVTAPTIEIARETVMPIIEDLYKTYAELPANGKRPEFISKANVIETERIVVPESRIPVKPATPTVAKKLTEETPPFPTYESFQKAENAIASAVSRDALKMIEDQIKKSVKINEEDKPILFMILLKRIKEVTSK